MRVTFEVGAVVAPDSLSIVDGDDGGGCSFDSSVAQQHSESSDEDDEYDGADDIGAVPELIGDDDVDGFFGDERSSEFIGLPLLQFVLSVHENNFIARLDLMAQFKLKILPINLPARFRRITPIRDPFHP